MKRVWYLNLDAEAELARPGAVNASRAMQLRCAAVASRIEGLVPAGDIAWTPGQAAPRAHGVPGVAWCPTPGAVRALTHAGATIADVLPWNILREANHRRFAASLGQQLPGAAYVTTESELAAVLRETSVSGVWLLKRALSYRGNARLRIRGREPDPREWNWIRASLSTGDGLQVEPEVKRLEDHGQHGWISPDGSVTWGALTRQRVDPSGAWLSTERLTNTSLSDLERAALQGVRQRLATELHVLGYRGPFGFDGFRWRDASETTRYCALCDLNARYSMGWAVGMGGVRPDLTDK